MRHALRRDLYPTASLATLTLGLLVYLAQGSAHPVRRPVPAPRALPPAGVAWTAPPHRLTPPARIAPIRSASARARTAGEVPSRAERVASGEVFSGEEIEVHGVAGSYEDEWTSDVFYGHRRGWWHRIRRYSRTGRVWRPQPAYPWVGASQAMGAGGGEGVRSACEVVPALCGELRMPSRRGATSPEVEESPAGVTLRNAFLAVSVESLARCAVRVRRVEDEADTLLTFDVPDERAPCEVRVVPDVFHDDGVALQIEARAPAWTQTVTVSLGADEEAPGVTIARATREGAAVSHALVNASPEPVTFTVAGRDVAVEPGEVTRLRAPSPPLPRAPLP